MRTLDDSAREFLSGRRYAILATLNDDGSIHTTPVWYLFENENFYIGSPSMSRKARNISARPTATILIDTRKPGSERWIYAAGGASILRGAESREINRRILSRYLTDEAIADPHIGPAFAAGDDITIQLAPSAWRSWNAEDVDHQFFGGMLGKSAEKWFRPVEE